MYKIVFFIFFIGLFSGLQGKSYKTKADYNPNSICYKLLYSSSRYLQSQKTKAKIRHQCLIKPNAGIKHINRLVKGCSYKIPAEWAEHILHPTINETNLFMWTKEVYAKCPVLTGNQFLEITKEGNININNFHWVTLQANEIKRLLSQIKELPPPSFIEPYQELEIAECKFGETIVKLIINPYSVV